MAEVQWIKFYIDMFTNPKIKKLRRLPDGDRIALIWVMFLALAGECNAGGLIYITENVPFTEEDLADELKFEITTIRLAVNAFQELGMIETNDGFISILNWEKYQNEDKLAEMREQHRLRQAKYRQKQKALKGDVTVTSPMMLGDGIEEEKEKDKDIHSFSLDEKETAKREFIGGELGGSIVLMSEEQFNDLLDKLSLDELHHYFEVVKNCELKGKKFTNKTHYQAILDMVAKDRKVAKKKSTPKQPKIGATYDIGAYEKMVNEK